MIYHELHLQNCVQFGGVVHIMGSFGFYSAFI